MKTQDVKVEELISIGGPIVALDGTRIVTLGKDDFLLWEVNNDNNVDLVSTLPRTSRGRFICDVICAQAEAEFRLGEYIKMKETKGE